MPTWSYAFLAALLAALVTVARCRRLAIGIGFVDVPGARKHHLSPIPYLGGVGLMAGVLTGLLFEYPIGSKVTLIALAATVLGTIGLVDDDRTVSPGYRFAAELVAAVIATAAGLRINATGIQAFDFALTVLWIVGITNALNLLDNMDGLAAGLTSVASAAVFALAVAEGQPVIATLSAAIVGACLGFLIFNRPPASIFMGDAGSLFLGFFLAVITIDVDSSLQSPRGFLVPLMLLGIPILDTTMVTLARLRRGRSVFMGGRDHLSHRLVARGLTAARAVSLLVLTEAMVATLAVLAGRRVIPVSWAVMGSVGILGTLVLRVRRVSVYEEPVVGFPKVVRRAAAALLIGAPLAAAPATIALFRAGDPARSGAQAAVDALRALEHGDPKLTAERFLAAKRSLAEADERLDGPLVSLGLVVPGLSSNLQAARTLVSVGSSLSNQGALLVDAYTAEAVTVRGGSVPIDEIRRLSPLLQDAERLLIRAQSRLSELDTGFVVPPLARAVTDARVRLASQTSRTSTVADLVNLLPTILGADEPRRYFLAFQNNAELRGSGGFMGNWGELVADKGRLRITRFGRQDDLNSGHTTALQLEGMDEFLKRWREFDVPRSWQQVNVSPDFPTTARAIAQLYPQSGGAPIDGVIAIDPVGLAGLLTLTGPVVVDGWDGPISATNVVDITLRQAYEKFAQGQRVEFLGDVAEKVAASLTGATITSPSMVGEALHEPTRGQHIKLYLNRPEEQRLVEALHADGAMPPVVGDSLMVVGQNMAANKIDYYAKRSVRYHVDLRPSGDGKEARVSGHLSVTLENTAPPAGLPKTVIGPYDARFRPGENRTYLSVYTPFGLRSAKVNGETVNALTDPDAGRLAHSVTVSVHAYQHAFVDMELAGELELSDDGWYRLDLPRQPLVHPDQLDVEVKVPRGWRIAQVRGGRITGERTASAKGSVSGPSTLWVQVDRDGLHRVADRLFDSSRR